MGLKHSSNLFEWSATVLAIVISFSGLIYASSKIPVCTCYAVFVGLGTAGTVIVEMIFFNEPFQFIKIVLIGVLLVGVLGLKLLSSSEKAGAH